jgi:hypothetical protein
MLHFALLSGLALGAVLAASVASADWQQDFQHNALFDPSDAQLQAESYGRIMIYDGLDDEVVEQALDQQFGRIENMMFIHIRHARPQPAGYSEDDDC